jgi:hypothetical protein
MEVKFNPAAQDAFEGSFVPEMLIYQNGVGGPTQ